MMTLLLALALVFTAFLIAFAILLALGHLDARRVSALRRVTELERGAITYLFDDETLRDATPSAHELLSTGPKRGTAWSRLVFILEPRFPNLNDWISDLAAHGEMDRMSKDGTSCLHAEWHDGVARITISTTGALDHLQTPDQHALAAMARELETLRNATDLSPHPAWQQTDDGTIYWCNRAYLDLADTLEGDERTDPKTWPPRNVFEIDAEQETSRTSSRAVIAPSGSDHRLWFEVKRQNIDSSLFCTATPVDDLVKAETSLSEFVTTLSKTFASLPVGLAIFNRERELAMFNPALLDLTTLPVDFLCAKPALASFLDRLRELQMMPEPKDYKSWRQRVADLVTRARNGTYEENWTLPTGQTYRVTGRPHPDGAVAFLFEDISTEVSHARRFRAEIETGHAALDAVPCGLAVFSTAGVLTLSNSAYGALWGYDPTEPVTEISLVDAIKRWQETTAPSIVWDEVRSFVGHASKRDPQSFRISLNDGRPVQLRLVPLSNGFTMVEFTVVTAELAAAIEPDEPAVSVSEAGTELALLEKSG
ncbi:MAG TPA: diguanylate cyclase [Maritimibacter sp.]|nr:diguanylate cyclase [Maritimibacter sp.]